MGISTSVKTTTAEALKIAIEIIQTSDSLYFKSSHVRFESPHVFLVPLC